MTEKEVEDIFYLDSGPLALEDGYGSSDGNRIRDLNNTNMFSFFKEKEGELEERDIIDSHSKMLVESINPSNSKLASLFRSSLPNNTSTFSNTFILPDTARIFSEKEAYLPFSSNSSNIPSLFGKSGSPSGHHLPGNSCINLQFEQTKNQLEKRMNQEIILENDSKKIKRFQFHELVKKLNEEYRHPSYWEDINNPRQKDRSIKGYGVITPDSEEEFKLLLEKHVVSQWNAKPQLIDEKYYRKSIDLLMMSIDSSLFTLDKSQGVFIMNNRGNTSAHISGKLSIIPEKCTASYLESYLDKASKLYQLKLVKQFLNQSKLHSSVTNQILLQILNEYLSFINKSLLEIPEETTLLEYYHTLQDLLNEIDFIHSIYLSNQPPLFTVTRVSKEDRDRLPQDHQFSLKSDAENINMLYRLSCDIYHTHNTSFIVKHLWREILLYLGKMINSMLFTNPKIDIITSSLKISYHKDSQGNYTFKQTPELLKRTMNPLFLATQSLSLLKNYEPDIFNILVSWYTFIPISWDRVILEESIQKAKKAYRSAEKKLEEVFIRVELGRQGGELQKMVNRLERLRKMKEKIENERIDRLRMKEIENFKRMQLQHFLEEQMAEKKMKNQYEKQLQLEMEKDIMYDRILKEQKAEKDKLLKEIEGLGRGIDDEIEKAVIQETLDRIKYESNLDGEELKEESVKSVIEGVGELILKEDDGEIIITIGGINKSQIIDLSEDKESNRYSTNVPLGNIIPTKFESNKSKHSSIAPDNPFDNELNFTNKYSRKSLRSDKNRETDSQLIDPHNTSKMIEEKLPNSQSSKDKAFIKKKEKDIIVLETESQLDDSKEIINEIVIKTPEKQRVESDGGEGSKRGTKTGKKLRQVEEKDLMVDLREMRHLNFSNLVNISKIQPIEADELAQDKDDELYVQYTNY